MSKGIAITYKGQTIASMSLDASGIKTLLTSGKYLEDNIVITVTAEAQNLINYFGYTDGKRLSTSTGDYRDKTGCTVIEYIDLSEFVENQSVVIHVKGIQFIHKSNPWDDNAYIFYKADKTANGGGYTTGTNSHGSVTFAVTSTSDTDATITITGLTQTIVSSSHRYLRLCGVGSGANVDIRVNE